MSSTASTLAGSDIATCSVRSPTNETGDRLVAADGGRGDELGGVRVDAEDTQVEVVEPEALGDRAGELVLGQRAGLQQHALGSRALAGGGLDRLVHRRALDEAEVDDHVAEYAARAAAPAMAW
jgi:hypothetical protein